MILPESRSIEWLRKVATENNFPNIALLEKSIHAFQTFARRHKTYSKFYSQ